MARLASALQILLLILLWLSPPAHAGQALAIDDYFTTQEIEKAAAGHIITHAYLKGSDPVSTENPARPIQTPANRYIDGTDFSAYEMIAVEKAFMPYPADDKSLLGLYNRLVSFSRLSGTPYYSRSEDTIKPFILSSFHVNATDRQPIEDPVYKSTAPRRSHYFQIEDNRFGTLLFRNDIYNHGKDFVITNRIEDPMRKFFFDINNAGEYQLIYYFFYDESRKGYFYYALNAMRVRSDTFLGLDMLTAENFANRIRAATAQTARLLGLDWDDRLSVFIKGKTAE